MAARPRTPKARPAAELTPALTAEIGRTDLLLPYQQRAITAVESHDVTVIEKGRRIGLTWGLAAGAVLWSAATKAAGGTDVLYIGYSADMAREFVDAAADWARLFDKAASSVSEGLFNDGDKDIKTFALSFASGFELRGLSSRPRSLRGKQGIVIIDEAAFVDDLGELLKAALALLMWGGKVVVVSTHDGVTNPFAELCEKTRAGKLPYHLVRITLDDALADGLYRRICLVRRRDWSPEAEAQWRAELVAAYGDGADEELFCVPRQSGGRYLARALIEAAMRPEVPVLRWTAPAGWVDQPDRVRQIETEAWIVAQLAPALRRAPRGRAAVGVDFGLVADLSVIWLLVTGPDLVRRTGLVIELGRMPYRQQEQVLFALLDVLDRRVQDTYLSASTTRALRPLMEGVSGGLDGVALDATGNGAILAQVTRQRYGALRVAEVKLSVAWYAAAMPPLKAALEDRTLKLPRDEAIRSDLELIEVSHGAPAIPASRTQAADGTSRHGDSAVAVTLAYQASQTAAPKIESWSAGGRRAGYSAMNDEDNSYADTGWGVVKGALGKLKGFLGFIPLPRTAAGVRAVTAARTA